MNKKDVLEKHNKPRVSTRGKKDALMGVFTNWRFRADLAHNVFVFLKVFVNPLTGRNEQRRLTGRLCLLEVPSGFEPLYKVLQTSA